MASAPVPAVDSGSFRDRDGRIYHVGSRILRGLSAGALADFEKLRATKFYQRFLGRGSLVASDLLAPEDVPLPPEEARYALLKREFEAFPYGFDETISVEELAKRLDGHSMRSVSTFLAVLRDIGIAKSAGGEGHRFTQEDIDSAWRDLPAPLSAREIEKYERFASGAS